MFGVIFICGNLFLRIAGKTAKIAKIRSHKKFVPHGKGTRFIRRFQKSREVSACKQCKMRTGCVRMVMRMADVKMRMEKKNGKVVEARGLSQGRIQDFS